MDYCVSITGLAFIDGIKELRKMRLKSISLRHCARVSREFLESLAMILIAEQLPKLKTINISNCKRLDSEGFKVFVDILFKSHYESCCSSPLAPSRVVSPVHNLRSFSVAENTYRDQDFERFLSLTPMLTSLHITNAYLTDNFMIHSSLRHLQHLTLNKEVRITDALIQHISLNCPSLISLDLSHCSLLTDLSVLALAENVPGLQDFTTSFCQKLITRDNVPSLLPNCHTHCAFCYCF